MNLEFYRILELDVDILIVKTHCLQKGSTGPPIKLKNLFEKCQVSLYISAKSMCKIQLSTYFKLFKQPEYSHSELYFICCFLSFYVYKATAQTVHIMDFALYETQNDPQAEAW